ncbi:MAG: hypothetical protein EBZ29_13205, partial [Synechococcaceae bacterium WB9_4xC_028]|nr:hypothetical protein [Synechococcaceae bacterium WB9_4xC_028]
MRVEAPMRLSAAAIRAKERHFPLFLLTALLLAVAWLRLLTVTLRLPLALRLSLTLRLTMARTAVVTALTLV